MLPTFIEKHQLPAEFATTAKTYYLPIAEGIFTAFKHHGAPYFVGINGCQGSGKSTFTAFVGEVLKTTYQLNIAVISLDDFYLTRQQRQTLAHNIHPLLATRGVPGTHNITQLEKTFTHLHRQETGYLLPKFDKSIDEPCPKSEWTEVQAPIDIILFEGWCWGISPQTEEQLQVSINELECQFDQQKKWRTYVNAQLAKYYQPLYQKMNYWIALQAPSFACVHQWRLEQEEKLIQKNAQTRAKKDNINRDSALMNSAQILHFIQHFQRLTVHGFNTVPQSANVALILDDSRAIKHVNKAKR